MNARYRRGWFLDSYRHHLAAKGIRTAYYQRKKPIEPIEFIRRKNAKMREKEEEFYENLSRRGTRRKGEMREISQRTLFNEPSIPEMRPGAREILPVSTPINPMDVPVGEEAVIDIGLTPEDREEIEQLRSREEELRAVQTGVTVPFIQSAEGGEDLPVDILERRDDGSIVVQRSDGIIQRVQPEDLVYREVGKPKLIKKQLATAEQDLGEMLLAAEFSPEAVRMLSPEDRALKKQQLIDRALAGRISPAIDRLLQSSEGERTLTYYQDYVTMQRAAQKEREQRRVAREELEKINERIANLQGRGRAVDVRALVGATDKEFLSGTLTRRDLRELLQAEGFTREQLKDTKKPELVDLALDVLTTERVEQLPTGKTITRKVPTPEFRQLRRDIARGIAQGDIESSRFTKGYQNVAKQHRTSRLRNLEIAQSKAEQRQKIVSSPSELSRQERENIRATERETGVKILGRQPDQSLKTIPTFVQPRMLPGGRAAPARRREKPGPELKESTADLIARIRKQSGEREERFKDLSESLRRRRK